MYTIYGFNTFNTEKVLITAEELALKYDYQKVDLLSGAQKEPEFLQIHPLGKLPALSHNGNTIIESAAICRYLANSNGHRLYSAQPLEAARIDALVDLTVQHGGRHISTCFYEKVVKKQFYQQQADEAAVAEALANLSSYLPYIDRLLGEHSFLCGDEVTIADTIAFPYFRLKESGVVDLAPYDNLLRWYDAFRERASVTASLDVLGPGLFE